MGCGVVRRTGNENDYVSLRVPIQLSPRTHCPPTRYLLSLTSQRAEVDVPLRPLVISH